MSRRNSRADRGARTLACRVHTRVNAKPRVGTRPQIVLNVGNQPSPNRIFPDVSRNPIPLALIANPVIVGLALPEGFAGAIHQSVSFPRGRSLERFQQASRRDQRQQRHMDMVCHGHKRPELVVSQSYASQERIDDNLRDRSLAQEHRAGARRIQIAIDPGEGFAGRGFRGRRKFTSGQAAVQRPCYGQPTVFGIAVGQAASGVHGKTSVFSFQKVSRSHECERGTHECVRHVVL